jgi:hypothetical protein
VTHVAELDALRGAPADLAKEQDATQPVSPELVAIPSEVPDATQRGSPELVATLSVKPDATHVVEQRAVQVRAAFLVLPRATRAAGLVGILNGSPELDAILSVEPDATRGAEALPTAIQSAAVPCCEVAVAKAWSSIHLGAACSLVRFLMEPVRFLMEPVAIHCELQAYEIPQAQFDVFLSPSVTRLSMNVAREQFWLRLLSDSSRSVPRRQIRPVWPSRACAGVRHSPWHTMCDRRVPPAHAPFAPVWAQCDARSSRFSQSKLARAGYRPVHRCRPLDLSSRSCPGARCFRLRRCCE